MGAERAQPRSVVEALLGRANDLAVWRAVALVTDFEFAFAGVVLFAHDPLGIGKLFTGLPLTDLLCCCACYRA